MLEAVHERLAGVVIECLPHGDFIERYDRPGVLFYSDPPYQGSEGDYGKSLFSAEDHARLTELLLSIKGRFVLSINDSQAIRKLYRRASIEVVETIYIIAGSDRAPNGTGVGHHA